MERRSSSLRFPPDSRYRSVNHHIWSTESTCTPTSPLVRCFCEQYCLLNKSSRLHIHLHCHKDVCYHLFNKLPASGNNRSACFRLGGGLQGPGSGAFPGLLSFPGVPGFTPSASPAALSGLHNPAMPSALLQVGTSLTFESLNFLIWSFIWSFMKPPPCLLPGSSPLCSGKLPPSAQQLHQLPSRPRKPLPPSARPPSWVAVRYPLLCWPLTLNLCHLPAADRSSDDDCRTCVTAGITTNNHIKTVKMGVVCLKVIIVSRSNCHISD